jgi:hypothetical protein
LNKTSSFVRAMLGGSALAIAVSFAGGAFAQGSTPVQGRAPTQAPTSSAALPSRMSESYEPQGARLGGVWRLLPSVEVGGYHDSNIFATQNNEIDDFVFVVAPTIQLKSDFAGPYSLNFKANSESLRYSDNDSENVDNYGIGFDGFYGIPGLGQNSGFRGGLRWDNLNEERGTPAAAASREPTEYAKGSGFLGFLYKPNRLGIDVGLAADSYDYKDGITGLGGIVNNDDRDRWEYRESLRVGYEFVPNYEGYVKGTLNQREYDSTLDDFGLARSSDGYEVVAGMKFGLSAITSIDVFGGYQSQSYDDARFPKLDGPTFGAQINWEPLRELNFRGYITRTIEESTSAVFAGYTNTVYGVEGKYKLFPNFEMRAGLSYATQEYEKLKTVAVNEREDDLFDASIGAKYYFTPNYYVDPSIRYRNRDSNTGTDDYDRLQVFVRLGAQY